MRCEWLSWFRMLLYLQILSMAPFRKIIRSNKLQNDYLHCYRLSDHCRHALPVPREDHCCSLGVFKRMLIQVYNGTILVHSPVNSSAIIEMVPISKVCCPLFPVCIRASVLEWWVRRSCLRIGSHSTHESRLVAVPFFWCKSEGIVQIRAPTTPPQSGRRDEVRRRGCEIPWNLSCVINVGRVAW